MKNLERVIVSLLGCLMSVPVLAAGNDFSSRWYTGGGMGLSRLRPNTADTIYNVSDSSSHGLKLYGGYDWNEKLTIEVYIADLGEAKLAPGGTLEYQDVGVSGLYYFYNRHSDRARRQRTHLSAFARAGLGYMKNDSNINFNRIHDTHVLLGAGVEYGLANGFAVRAEAEFFDKDSQFYSISLLKRFGRLVQLPVGTSMKGDRLVDIALLNKSVNEDSDDDGIVDSQDQCPDTREQARVDRQGCEIGAVIVLKGVQFASGSAGLKDLSGPILNAAATTLLRYPEVKVEVAGHTDSQGGKNFNQGLSYKRANAVRQYLIKKGVPANNLTVRGYGDSQPVEQNNTVEGRAANRRVELRILNKK